MADKFNKKSVEIDSPLINGFAITPSNVTVFDQPTRSIYVGQGGTLAVTMIANTSLTFVNVPSGTLLPYRVIQVLATTTANNIVGLF